MKSAGRAQRCGHHSRCLANLKKFFRSPVFLPPSRIHSAMTSQTVLERKYFLTRDKSDRAGNDKLALPEYHKHLLHKH